uniref:Uncharacterized protein n=1 Tax=Salix viminalis TaxID=40686 RepID=A0A6N2K6J1_SALVM
MVEHEKNEGSFVSQGQFSAKCISSRNLTTGQIHVVTLGENLRGKTKELGAGSFIGVVVLDDEFCRISRSVTFEMHLVNLGTELGSIPFIRVAVQSGLSHRPDKNSPEVEQGRHSHEGSREPDIRRPTFAKNHVVAL